MQSGPEKRNIISRLALLYQDLIRAGKLGKGDKLPPVLPVEGNGVRD